MNNQLDAKVFPKVRLWPAIAIAVAQFISAWLLFRYGSTNIHNAIALGGVPVIALLAFLIWWLAASRVSLRDRFIGVVLFIAAMVVVVVSQQSIAMGGMLLARALPYLTHGLVLLLVCTFFLPWSVRRWFLVAFIVLVVAIASAMRVDSIGGDLFPVISWRWELTADQRSGALAILEVQERAEVPQTPVDGDWPAFRGPRRDGRVEGVRFSTDWRTPPKEVWRRAIGSAWSAFILVGDYLFTQEQRGPYELVTCYHADTGAPVWQNRIEAKFEDGMGLGPRATPSYAAGYLYAQGCTGLLQCIHAATGETVWKRDLREEFGARLPEWGFSVSPLVAMGLAMVFADAGEGKSVIAFDCETGETVWSAGRPGGGYASPHFALLGNVPQVLMVSNFGIQSFALSGGEALWAHPWDIKTNPRCTQPAQIGSNRVLFGATGTSGSRVLQVQQSDSGWGVEEIWTTRQFRPYFNDGALHKGYYYGFDGERVSCLDIEGGRRLWSGERYSGQLLLLPDMDMLLILSEAGDIVLVPAVPQQFTELARFKALSGKTWNHPLIANGRLFVRNAEEAACYELPEFIFNE